MYGSSINLVKLEKEVHVLSCFLFVFFLINLVL